MMYVPLKTVGWPDWYLRKSCFSYKTSNPGFCARFLADTAEHAAQDGGEEKLGVGASVVLCGLSAEEFNGRRGRIVSKGGKEGRWGVHVAGADEPSKPLSISAAHLQLVAPAEGEGEGAGW